MDRCFVALDRKSTRLNSSHTEIYTLSLHDALPIYHSDRGDLTQRASQHRNSTTQRSRDPRCHGSLLRCVRSEEHTSELQSHRDLHSFPTRRSSDLPLRSRRPDAKGVSTPKLNNATKQRSEVPWIAASLR